MLSSKALRALERVQRFRLARLLHRAIACAVSWPISR